MEIFPGDWPLCLLWMRWLSRPTVARTAFGNTVNTGILFSYINYFTRYLKIFPLNYFPLDYIQRSQRSCHFLKVVRNFSEIKTSNFVALCTLNYSIFWSQWSFNSKSILTWSQIRTIGRVYNLKYFLISQKFINQQHCVCWHINHVLIRHFFRHFPRISLVNAPTDL